jgi:hypothetical protein
LSCLVRVGRTSWKNDLRVRIITSESEEDSSPTYVHHPLWLPRATLLYLTSLWVCVSFPFRNNHPQCRSRLALPKQAPQDLGRRDRWGCIILILLTPQTRSLHTPTGAGNARALHYLRLWVFGIPPIILLRIPFIVPACHSSTSYYLTTSLHHLFTRVP